VSSPAGRLIHDTPGLRWRRVLRGEERQLSELRRWHTSLLPEGRVRDDVISVATELGTNAVRHTASGRGGWFAVEIALAGRMIRVTVADQGAPGEPQVIDDPLAEHGRGLTLVAALAARAGVCGDQHGRLVWAEVFWDGPDAAAFMSSQDPYETMIRHGHAELARRLSGMPAWFGRSTLQWWALTGPAGLVSAQSASALADLLDRAASSAVSSMLTSARTPKCSTGRAAVSRIADARSEKWGWGSRVRPVASARQRLTG